MQTQRERGSTGLAIRNLEVWPIRQPGDGRTHVIVRLSTEGGTSGWGEAAVQSSPAATVGQLQAAGKQLLGQDASRIEYLRRFLDAGHPGARGDWSAVQAALNMAFVDILGKRSRAPAYEVFGGPTRGKARAITRLTGRGEAERLASLGRLRRAGFRALIVSVDFPPGPTRGRAFYRDTLGELERLREAGEGEIDFVLDCGGRTTPAEAATLASLFERFHLLWLEHPTRLIQREGLAKLADESATPIGWGRQVTSIAAFQDLLRRDAIDVVCPDIGLFGMTLARKAAALAETYYVAVAPSHRGTPISSAAALHVAASIPNFYILEIPYPEDEADRRMRDALGGGIEAVRDGFLSLPTGHGLGITVDQEALERYRVDA